MNVTYMREHDAGLELLGRGTGVPESLCTLADEVYKAYTGEVPDSMIAAVGAVLLQRRADNAEFDKLRKALREGAAEIAQAREERDRAQRESMAYRTQRDTEGARAEKAGRTLGEYRAILAVMPYGAARAYPAAHSLMRAYLADLEDTL